MTTLIAFILTIGIVVVFHEFGHYLACRLFGVHVQKFSIGFGKVLLEKKTKSGTRWLISMLPFGGYVLPLSKESEAYQPELKQNTIESKAAWKRFVIYAAGPFFSFLLAILIYSILNMFPSQEPKAILAEPEADTVVAQAGLNVNDQIVSLDGVKIQSWLHLRELLTEPLVLGEKVKLGFIQTKQLNSKEISGSSIKTVEIIFPKAPEELENVDLMSQAGFNLQAKKVAIKEVIPGGAAEEAGLRPGDEILGFCQSNSLNLQRFLKTVQTTENTELCIIISREQQDYTVNLTPKKNKENNQSQLGVQLDVEFDTTARSLSPFESVAQATDKTITTALFSIKMIGKMLSNQISWKNLSGPVAIADFSGKAVQSGVVNYFSFVALISLGIGVLNLLPIPGLDGGQMMLCLIEIFRRKPLSDQTMRFLYSLGYSILIILFIFTLTNDLSRFF